MWHIRSLQNEQYFLYWHFSRKQRRPQWDEAMEPWRVHDCTKANQFNLLTTTRSAVMFRMTGLNYFRHFPSSSPYFFSRVCSFNNSTLAHVKIMHIDAQLWLLEHFEKSVKLAKSAYYRRNLRNQPIVAHTSRLRCVILCSKSHNCASICIILHVLMWNDWMNTLVKKIKIEGSKLDGKCLK